MPSSKLIHVMSNPVFNEHSYFEFPFSQEWKKTTKEQWDTLKVSPLLWNWSFSPSSEFLEFSSFHLETGSNYYHKRSLPDGWVVGTPASLVQPGKAVFVGYELGGGLPAKAVTCLPVCLENVDEMFHCLRAHLQPVLLFGEKLSS